MPDEDVMFKMKPLLNSCRYASMTGTASEQPGWFGRIKLKCVSLLCWLLATPAIAADPGHFNPVEFNRDIRPLLSDNCFKCHGFDPNTRKADLRLDKAETAMAERDGVRPIVPGNPESSELFRRITSDDPDERMPPTDSGKELSPTQIERIRQWINQGAEYQRHWAFIPPERPPIPTVTRKDWPRTPIDHFVLARLEEEGLSPSPAADKETLIRRVTLDLTGVPPSIEEVDAFLADTAPGAYERVVDRLLASHRYGERMAQPWLDAARYADTMGYQADWERYQWRWRTWVIDAYNRNLPFDQFTIEQLAGDLLPDPTVEQMIATGFNRNHRINDEAGIIPEEFLVEYVVDRVKTTSATWMGLTMGCARCHDHKFDPFSQADFYRFFDFFNRVPEKGKEGRKGYATPYMRVAMRGKQDQYEKLQQLVAKRERKLNAAVDQLQPERNRWIEQTVARLEAREDPWSVIAPANLHSESPTDFQPLEDDSYLVTKEPNPRPIYTIELAPDGGVVTGIRLEALTHKSLGNGGLSPGNGNFVLTGFEVELHRRNQDQPQPLKITGAKADYAQEKWPVADSIDGKKLTGWAVEGHNKPENRAAVFTLDQPIHLEPGDRLIVRLRHQSEHARHSIGRFRLALTDMKQPDFMETFGLPQDVLGALLTDAKARTDKQRNRLTDYHAGITPHTKALRDELDQSRQTLADFEEQNVTYVMVMKEMEDPRETHILQRGQYDQKGKPVRAGVPADVLGPLPEGAPVNRLGLARWLVSGDHPLTGRVIVNRYWSMLFGRGLVETIEDFGLQGKYPTHPDLLDWLATEYPRIGWDTKALLKTMVMSATYRQSSRFPKRLRQRDPQNRLLARMSRIRLPAETIRDQALFASGLLEEQIGGPSVKPYQPKGLWSELSFQDKRRSTDFYEQDTGKKLYRRSIYTFWKRSVPPPTMATFDAPSRETCTLNRPRTNTPMQALALMNDVTYVEAARALAARAVAHTETGDGTGIPQIGFMFRALLSRQPDRDEFDLLKEGLFNRQQYYQQNPEAAEQLIAQGESKPRSDVSPVKLAALTTVAMNILNLDETITRE